MRPPQDAPISVVRTGKDPVRGVVSVEGRTPLIIVARSAARVSPLVGLLLGAITAVPVAAQGIPDDFSNLQLLPDDISRRQLIGIMGSFSDALGVGCAHCHTVSDDLDSPDDDFASDEKPAKGTARAMMAMLEAINADHIARLADRDERNFEVACVTCHAGKPAPVTLVQELTWAADEGGFGAVKARYDELREDYFGRGAYDFGPASLERVAQVLARNDADAALAVIALNLEHHPESVPSWLLRGQIHTFEGQADAAVEAYERVLELEPGHRAATQALERMRGGGL